MHEFELISKHFLALSKNNKSSLDLNDDVFFDKSKKLVVSVDTYVEGVHFINFKKPDLVIKKIIRSSISDLICKGVKPKYYFISGSGNHKSFSSSNLVKISQSLKQEQKKYRVFLSGGDTVWSKKLSFTITSVGFSKKIIFRNKAKINDDIYVTGTLGDSYAGLNILKKKINTSKILKNYFENKYYQPRLCLELTDKLLSFANTSIDISDGLIADLEKLINKQKLSYKLDLNDIPISKNLFKLLTTKFRIISKIAKSSSIKISKIGKICTPSQKSEIIDQKGKKIAVKYKGFYHKF